ncbi:MAG: L,D-transpeptidase [Acidimicrobiales bacterium]|jgi:lipoprotein-anchoring transpeptidase ErfK/SrfK
MDRRRFLLGASALGVTACAQPERELLDEFADATIPLEPGAPRSTTTSVAPVESQAPDEPKPDNGLPVDVPDEDLPGLSFVAEAIVPSVGVSATRAVDEPIMEFANPIPSGGPLVFLVEDLADLNRMEVLLPTRPNGSFGWINGSDVRLTRHNYAIEVRLDDFLLILYERGLPIFEATVGVARENAPTPLGRYYTTELLRPPRPDSVYGAYAYGLSGYSETFTTFAGGDGQLGIHGTNDPDSLGTNVSSGCVRLHNDDVTYLVETVGLPIGVPVDVI